MGIFRFGPVRIPSFDPAYIMRYAICGCDASPIMNMGYNVDSMPGHDLFAPIDPIFMKGKIGAPKVTNGFTRVPSRVGGGNQTILTSPQYRFSSKMIKNGPVPIQSASNQSAGSLSQYLKSNQFRVTY
jgi:hypothetical protein